MRAPLFTELGLVPLRYRRLILALRYLGYLINLAATHYAKAALEDSYQLYLKGCQGYWMDLVYALQNLRFPVTLPALPELTPEKCTALTKEVHIAAMRHLDAEVNSSTHLYMLHDRLELLEDEPPKKMTAFLRHYLVLVVNAKHRKALTRLLAGEELLQYRNAYTTIMQTTDPRIATVAPWNATNVLRSLIFRRETVCQSAKFVCKVFAIFDAVPMANVSEPEIYHLLRGSYPNRNAIEILDFRFRLDAQIFKGKL
ncbi:hypothetical protein DFH07DRAFT_941127 [Mycena maculata]|uniref:Uncharacterized protein n=1 Tax=Mycena maculata TaxID=230809 RepID=A0AAD7J039_9AGAR|nr:hypothetical protein DFH07DRAFT_941127 [Mycena maculata]